MNDRPIGVFDSGLGGLTVFQALADLLPDEHLLYLGDTARYPYGPRSRDELQRFAVEITSWLVDQGVKMVIVACNSATAAALDLLRASFEVPIVGVVEPGVRAALSVTRSGRVGVVGTEMTAASKVYEAAAEHLRADLDLSVLACPGFVEIVEDGDTGSERAHRIVAAGLEPLLDWGIDTLVLGCTHYPLLARTIGDVVGREVTLVSSADETAFEVRDLLERTGWIRDRSVHPSPATRSFVTTGDPERFRVLGERFLGYPLHDVSAHRWD